MHRLVVVVLAFAASHVLASPKPHEVFGLFQTEGSSHVEIRDCGDGTPCGYIVWIDPASLDAGKTPESLRTKASNEPVLGLLMLQGFSRHRTSWKSGSIYNPKTNKSYRAGIRRLPNDSLEVRPCVGPFCQTQIWTPVLSDVD